jgi:hypothetical protein
VLFFSEIVMTIWMKMKKDEINRIIDSGDYPALGQLFIDQPSKVRILLGRLSLTDDLKLTRTLDAFQIAAKVFEHERLLDLCRKLMWMLNEESGNNCPNAALALGHIAQVDPGAVEPHVPVLQVYAEDPSELIRVTVRKALPMIRRASKIKK